MTDIIDRLRGEHLDCNCMAHSSSECCCDTEWPESSCKEAADEIERLREELKATQNVLAQYAEGEQALRRDAERWRYWRSLYDITEQDDEAAQEIARAMTPDELDAAVDKAMAKEK